RPATRVRGLVRNTNARHYPQWVLRLVWRRFVGRRGWLGSRVGVGLRGVRDWIGVRVGIRVGAGGSFDGCRRWCWRRGWRRRLLGRGGGLWRIGRGIVLREVGRVRWRRVLRWLGWGAQQRVGRDRMIGKRGCGFRRECEPQRAGHSRVAVFLGDGQAEVVARLPAVERDRDGGTGRRPGAGSRVLVLQRQYDLRARLQPREPIDDNLAADTIYAVAGPVDALDRQRPRLTRLTRLMRRTRRLRPWRGRVDAEGWRRHGRHRRRRRARFRRRYRSWCRGRLPVRS